jgi:hypothetical protein
MYSEYSSSYVAANCIDGDLSTVCHSDGRGSGEYLRVGFAGGLNDLATIVVTNRPDCGQTCKDRIDGAKLHVTALHPTSNLNATASAL